MTGLDVLRSMLGLNERTNEEQLKTFFKKNSVHNDISLNPNGSEAGGLPWCAAAVNAAERQAYGLQAGTGSLMARSFLKYGKVIYDRDKKLGKMTDGKEGDIAIWERGSFPHGHVNYIETPKLGGYQAIGGNQGDAITRGFYSSTDGRLLGIRRSPFND